MQATEAIALREYAKKELAIALESSLGADDDFPAITENVLDLVKTIAVQESFGNSHKLVASWLFDLVRFIPLTPLTGEDSEWEEIPSLQSLPPGSGRVWQNVRCRRVYKTETYAFDADGINRVSKDGKLSCSGGFRNHRTITFPYYPSEVTEVMTDEEVAESYARLERLERESGT